MYCLHMHCLHMYWLLKGYWCQATWTRFRSLHVQDSSSTTADAIMLCQGRLEAPRAPAAPRARPYHTTPYTTCRTSST